MKDNFSTQANAYVKFRPVYPQALYDWLLTQVNEKDCAWDCGTGNGQVAGELSEYFKSIAATDISEAQLSNAIKKDNIHYKAERAEHTSFPDHSFDLITVAQAIHWFDFDAFYREVNRTIKPGGILAVIGYGVVSIDETIDPLLQHFYKNVVGPYWDKERHYIDESYETIPFPYQEIPSPRLYIEANWTLNHFLGYLETWSAVQHYKKANSISPVEQIKNELCLVWKEAEVKQAKFPVLLRVARID